MDVMQPKSNFLLLADSQNLTNTEKLKKMLGQDEKVEEVKAVSGMNYLA